MSDTPITDAAIQRVNKEFFNESRIIIKGSVLAEDMQKLEYELHEVKRDLRSALEAADAFKEFSEDNSLFQKATKVWRGLMNKYYY